MAMNNAMNPSRDPRITPIMLEKKSARVRCSGVIGDFRHSFEVAIMVGDF